MDLRRLDADRRRIRQDGTEASSQGFPALGALDLPAAAHGSILLGNGQELEPDSLDLQRAGEELR